MPSNYTIINGRLLNADELAHGYKYIKKEPDGKGGYRYYYKIGDRKSSAMYEKTETYGNKDSVYGVYKHNARGPGSGATVIKRRSNTLFGSKYTLDTKTGKIEYDNDGIIEQAVNDGKKAVKRLFSNLNKKLKKKK